MNSIRWGILGTGNIARQFADALKLLPDAQIAAVASRTQDSADRFGEDYGIARRHGTYEGLYLDNQVDAVYVATPHTLHKENTLACLASGKAVLCEKPFAMNAREAKAMIGFADAKGLFLMEAMWTRYFPVFHKIRELLGESALSEVLMVSADFGFRAAYQPAGRLFNPALGGGALLDIGIYPVSLASMVFGRQPETIQASAVLGETRVDEQTAMIFGYSGGKQAILSSSFRCATALEAHIIGAQGRIRIAKPWWYPAAMAISLNGGEEEVIHLPYIGNGYAHEAIETMRCLRDGARESAIMPLRESLAIMETLDSIRGICGIHYPADAG